MIQPWLIALLVSALASGITGWTVRGWRADAAISELRATIAQSVASATTEARAIERKQQEAVNGILARQNADLGSIADRLRVDLERLRKRPGRPAADMPGAPAIACPGASGAELARGDAEFLIRYAALAAEQDTALTACYEVIDASWSGYLSKINDPVD